MSSGRNQPPVIMSIIELGGYPDFSALYRRLGYEVVVMPSMRKAIRHLKTNPVDIIVAEFNYQSDFRDRTSQLESLMASLASSPDVQVVVFYDLEQADKFQRFIYRERIQATLTYPVTETKLEQTLAGFSGSPS